MAARHLSDGNPDGNILGQSATDLIAFYGGTPTARVSFSTSLVITAVVDASGNAVFSTSDSFQAVIARINNLESKLVTLGLAARA